MIAPTVEEHRAHGYETEFAMLIGTSMIQVVSDYVTLLYIKFGHPYGYYSFPCFICVDANIRQLHIK